MIKLPKAGEIVEYDVMTFPTFDWNDLFKSRTIEKSIDSLGDEGIRLIHDKEKLPSLVVHDATHIPQVNLMNQEIKHVRRPTQPFDVNCHAYISFARNSDVFGFHDDLDDVYIWQCYGTTDWEVPKYNIQNTLLPGQMIYIPAGVKHRAIVTGPRISVSFSIGT